MIAVATMLAKLAGEGDQTLYESGVGWYSWGIEPDPERRGDFRLILRFAPDEEGSEESVLAVCKLWPEAPPPPVEGEQAAVEP